MWKKTVLKWACFVHKTFRCILHSLWSCRKSEETIQSQICAYYHVGDLVCCPREKRGVTSKDKSLESVNPREYKCHQRRICCHVLFFLFVIVVVVVVVAGTQWCLCGIEKGASATKYFKTVGLQGKGK